ncbi:MAG: hypothetical protein HRT47_12205 [Candidatus Caenarcaniphilales bacterium]|nr:hypothetical protein [Candidatus Caenarcaniphilales bacterium]
MSFWKDYSDGYIYSGDNPSEDFYREGLYNFLPETFAVKTKTKDGLDIILLIKDMQINHLIISPIIFFDFYAEDAFRSSLSDLFDYIQNIKDHNIKVYLEDLEISSSSVIRNIEDIYIENYSHYSCFTTFKESTLNFIKEQDAGVCLLYEIANNMPLEYIYDYLPTILILIKLTEFDSGLNRLGIHSGTIIRETGLNLWFSFDEFYRKNKYCLTSKRKLNQHGLFCNKLKYDQFIDKDKPNKFYTSLRKSASYNEIKQLILNFILESIELNQGKESYAGGYIPKLHNTIKGFIHDKASEWLTNGYIKLKEDFSEIQRVDFKHICSEISHCYKLSEGHVALHVPAIFSFIEEILQEIKHHTK